MKISNQLCFIMFLSSLIAAWSQNISAGQRGTSLYPVEWYEELPMFITFEKPIKTSEIKNIGDLLSEKWYTGIHVYKGMNSPGEKEKVISNCLEYLAIRGQGYSVTPERSASAFMGRAMRCSAIEALANAKPAKISNLSDFALDESLPSKLPKQMAFIASTTEYNRIMKNSSIKTLTDVHKVTKVEMKDKTNAIYKHKGGEQDITLVGKGDFNDDGILDLLLIVQNDVSGGSFSSTHLYALTKMAPKGDYVLLKEYEY